MYLNWHERPMLRLVLPLITGIAIGVKWDISPIHLLILWAVLFAISTAISWIRVSYRLRWGYGLSLNCLMVLTGWLLFQVHDHSGRKNILGELDGQKVLMQGSIQEVDQKTSSVRVQICINLIKAQDSLVVYRVQQKVLVTLPIQSSASRLLPGDQLHIQARLRSIPAPKNPGQFDFQRYARFQHLYFQAYVQEGEWRLVGSKKWHIRRQAGKLRNYLSTLIRETIPDQSIAGVANSLLLGNRDHIPEETLNQYRKTGAAHVLAVSGLHVGLVFLLLNALMNIWKGNQRWHKLLKNACILMGIWAFALVCGGSPSVIRAATLFSFVIMGKLLSRRPDIYNSLAGSCFLLLCIDPFYCFQIGFQLSYLAVLGIVFFHPKLDQFYQSRNPLFKRIWSLMCVSIAAQLVTFPLTVFYFHQFPVWFWASGLIVVPMAGLILPVGLLLFALHWIPVIHQMLSGLLTFLIQTMNEAIQLLESLNKVVDPQLWISGWEMLLCFGMVAGIAAFTEVKKRNWLLVPAMCLGLLLLVNGVKTKHQQQQIQLILYSIKNQNHVDLFIGKKAFSFAKNRHSVDKLPDFVRTYRSESGVKEVHYLPFEGNFRHKIFLKKGGLLRIGNKVIVRINDGCQYGGEFQADIVVVESSSGVIPVDCLDSLRPRLVVLGRNLPYRAMKNWSDKCRDKGISIHNMFSDGAFILDQFE